MTEYGIWSHEDDGFVQTQIYSRDEGVREIAQMVATDPEVATYTLSVVEICPDHEEQPKDGCEECAAEEHDDEQDEDADEDWHAAA